MKEERTGRDGWNEERGSNAGHRLVGLAYLLSYHPFLCLYVAELMLGVLFRDLN